MSKKNPDNLELQIRAIELLDSCLNTPKKQLPNNSVFQFDINLEHRQNVENKHVIVVCSVSIFTEKKEELLGQVKVSCIYYVPRFDEFIVKNSSDPKFPDDFVIKLNSITISTTRGMMFSFFRGTFLHNAILPMVDQTIFSVSSSK
ncbi:MAG: hypothetical protein ACFCUU_09625 [Cyclobacteriaceae bacterium]